MTAKAAQEPLEEDPRLVQARARLQAERARLLAVREAQTRRPPPGVRWNPSPTQGEADLTSARSVVPNKAYDLSPIDQQSFDTTEPPPLPAMPANAAPPFVTELTDLAVGSLLVASQGTWTPAGLVYNRQWRRNGAAIWGATAISYTLSYLDIGARISATVRATNAGGSASADAAPVGPVTAAP